MTEEKAIAEFTVTYCRWFLSGLGWKQGKSVTHTGVTHLLHSQGRHRDLRKADGRVVAALVGHHEPHQGRRLQAGLQATVPDQIVVDNGVEVAVVHNIVHVAILVVILPSCLDG